jgi:hypothetical protein
MVRTRCGRCGTVWGRVMRSFDEAGYCRSFRECSERRYYLDAETIAFLDLDRDVPDDYRAEQNAYADRLRAQGARINAAGYPRRRTA